MKKLLVAILILTALAAQAWAQTVTKVHDGDTVTVGETHVRLFGIDAPELRQAGGKAARDFLASLVLDKTVRLDVQDTDAYGRTVARVLLPDGREAGYEMVKAGHAWVYRKYCRRCYGMLAAEAWARARGLGLWSEDRPMAPWRWRKLYGRHP